MDIKNNNVSYESTEKVQPRVQESVDTASSENTASSEIYHKWFSTALLAWQQC